MKELLNSLQAKCKGLKAHEFVSVQVADMQQILFAIEKLEQSLLFVQQFGRAVRYPTKPAVLEITPENNICSGPGGCVSCDGNCVSVSLEPCEFKNLPGEKPEDKKRFTVHQSIERLDFYIWDNLIKQVVGQRSFDERTLNDKTIVMNAQIEAVYSVGRGEKE